MVEKVKGIPASPKNVKAATKVQSMFRKKKATERVSALKKISGELKDLEGEQPLEKEKKKKKKKKKNSSSGEWTCVACTFVNPNSRSKCEMCDTPKP